MSDSNLTWQWLLMFYGFGNIIPRSPSSLRWPPGVWRRSCLQESRGLTRAQLHPEPRLHLQGRWSIASLVHSSAQQIWAEVDLKGRHELVFPLVLHFFFLFALEISYKLKYLMCGKIRSFLYDEDRIRQRELIRMSVFTRLILSHFWITRWWI